MSDVEVNGMCHACGGKCCQYFCFQIDEPDSFEEFEDLRWYLLHEGITLHIDEGDWYISIANRCKALRGDGRCAIYERRALICRRYSRENCDFAGGDYGYDASFETPDDIVRYAQKKLGKKAYRKARDKAHAKLARNGAKRQRKAARKKAKNDREGGRKAKGGGRAGAGKR